jgi:hypothetical protein
MSLGRPLRRPLGALRLCGLAALLAACASSGLHAPARVGAETPQALIDAALPRTLSDRAGWANDIYAGVTVLGVAANRDNMCAIVAVIAQESSFAVDPVVPDLGKVAWQEIDTRAARAHVPRAIVHGVLQLKSADGRSYAERIDHAQTEKQLSDVYEDFIGAVPLGKTLFSERIPIRTRGPMQVNIAFAERYAKVRTYPYPIAVSIPDEVFTRRGGLYFGIAHLLDYAAPYDRYLYRFADFNAGQYASRNAAFQSAVSRLSGIALIPDGVLVPADGDIENPDNTQRALLATAKRLNLGSEDVLEALAQSRSADFERTLLYRRVFAQAEREAKHRLPRALVPQIVLHSPKITRTLTTAWYANRVEQRFESCLTRSEWPENR